MPMTVHPQRYIHPPVIADLLKHPRHACDTTYGPRWYLSAKNYAGIICEQHNTTNAHAIALNEHFKISSASGARYSFDLFVPENLVISYCIVVVRITLILHHGFLLIQSARPVVGALIQSASRVVGALIQTGHLVSRSI